MQVPAPCALHLLSAHCDRGTSHRTICTICDFMTDTVAGAAPGHGRMHISPAADSYGNRGSLSAASIASALITRSAVVHAPPFAVRRAKEAVEAGFRFPVCPGGVVIVQRGFRGSVVGTEQERSVL